MESSTALMVVAGAVAALFGGLVVVFAVYYRRVAPGQALLVTRMGPREPLVTFTGALVLPVIQRADVIDITVKTIAIEVPELRFSDGQTRSVAFKFYVKVLPTADDVRRVASQLGCERASDPATLEDLFAAKFIEAIKMVAARITAAELEARLGDFRDEILTIVGVDLNGFVLDDLAVDFSASARVSVGRVEPADDQT